METEELASIFDSVNILPFKPGDTLVFRCQIHLTDKQRSKVRESLQQVFGSEIKTLVLDGGADLAVLRKEYGECDTTN